MTNLKWADVYYKPIEPIFASYDPHLEVGTIRINVKEPIDFIDSSVSVDIGSFVDHVSLITDYTYGTCQPQLAYYVFAVTRRPIYIEGYFPITKSLPKDKRHQFHQMVSKVMTHPNFDLELRHRNLNYLIQKLPALGYLVAGHIVELFFYRQDILDLLLNSTIHIWLYTDPDSFKADGGVAGGCYNPERKCVQLVVSRLFEGFNQPTPGVCPFLHEFGHLLDFFDAGAGKAHTVGSGWLPGMRSSDGDMFTPEAREAFIAGKRLEMQRYERQVANADGSDPLPIGHPYVFQSNSEFIAGYLEMFFRNPYYFASQNPDLFNGFARLLGQDPRQYWEADFPFYIQQNRDFYHSGKKPPMHGLTLNID